MFNQDINVWFFALFTLIKIMGWFPSVLHICERFLGGDIILSKSATVNPIIKWERFDAFRFWGTSEPDRRDNSWL